MAYRSSFSFRRSARDGRSTQLYGDKCFGSVTKKLIKRCNPWAFIMTQMPLDAPSHVVSITDAWVAALTTRDEHGGHLCDTPARGRAHRADPTRKDQTASRVGFSWHAARPSFAYRRRFRSAETREERCAAQSLRSRLTRCRHSTSEG